MPIEDTENIRNEIDQMIYKEQQETKLLRIKYESILDGLDKEIEKLEGWIGKRFHNNILCRREITNYLQTRVLFSMVLEEKYTS